MGHPDATGMCEVFHIRAKFFSNSTEAVSTGAAAQTHAGGGENRVGERCGDGTDRPLGGAGRWEFGEFEQRDGDRLACLSP